MALFGMYSVRLGEVQNGLDNRTKTNSDGNSRLSAVSELRSVDTRGPSAPKHLFTKSTKAAPKQQPLDKWHARKEGKEGKERSTTRTWPSHHKEGEERKSVDASESLRDRFLHCKTQQIHI